MRTCFVHLWLLPLLPNVEGFTGVATKRPRSSFLCLSHRPVASIERYSRLPVWPLWNGIFTWAVSQVLGEETAAKLEDQITGRVCPNIFQPQGRHSPFLLLVHHCHSFHPLDPWRYLQRLFFPEGFPAHPHRGFVTLTYILHGGFRHRDSHGVEQYYGGALQQQDPQKQHSYDGKHSQWLQTGAGILHEEMFDARYESRQELYQLWIQLPRDEHMSSPYSFLMGDDKETPVVVQNQTQTRVLAGSYKGATALAPNRTAMAIYHVQLEKGATWTCEVPEVMDSVLLYVRRGSLLANEQVRLPVHHTVTFAASGGSTIELRADEGPADCLFLAGESIREPLVMQGSMVVDTPENLSRAMEDYQRGAMGRPWSETLTDKEWRDHVQKYGSWYR